MQMPNASPQGIAGLMQKPPGQVPGQQPQQPMPSPMKASPMAGLGSVDDRVSAYQGNTKPLEQRYAMSQDLLDLLALQKIKSQKEAAARQMQMQMAQQNAQNGQTNMTVAQQREQEVNELTKNELAQQRGETAQKQTGDQQAMLQKMMSGVAAAPGAAMVAQPKMMATGGIVGFDGTEGSSVEDPRRKRNEGESTQDYRRRMFELELQLQRERNAAIPVDREAERQRRLRERGEIIPASPLLDRAPLPKSPQQAAAEVELAKRQQAQGPAAPAGLAGLRGTMGDQAGDFPATNGVTRQAPPGAMPGAAGPAAPRPPAMPGAAGPAGPAGPAGAAVPPPVQPGAVGPANDFGTKQEAAALKNAEIDPAARQLSEEQRTEARMALTPEQRKVYEEGIGGLQKMYQEQYDPERQRREGITRALIGAGGRRYGEFAGAAEAGMRYNDQQRAAKLKEFGDIQNARTGLVGIDRTNVKDAIGAGQKAYEQSSMGQRQGLQSGASLYGDDLRSRDTRYNIDVGSRDKSLDREVDKLKISAQNAATAAAREGLSQDKNRNLYLSQLNRVEQLERNLDKDFAAGPVGMLLMQDPSKLKPEDKNRLDIARLELEQKKAKIRRDMEPVLADVRRTLGITDSKLSPEDQAAIAKYAKGK